MKRPTVYNIKIESLIDTLKDVLKEGQYVDIVLADEFTLRVRPSNYHEKTPDFPEEDMDANQLIV